MEHEYRLLFNYSMNMSTRTVRNFFGKWKYLMLACCVTYLFVIYIPISKENNSEKMEEVRFQPKDTVEHIPSHLISNNQKQKQKKTFNFNPKKGNPFEVEEVLTYNSIKLAERMKANVKSGEKRVILSYGTGLSAANLGGCPEWNCEFIQDRSRIGEADAILVSHYEPNIKAKSNQYVIYVSQESPANSGINVPHKSFINMTFGFRHDTPAGSPYGYTVKLGPNSRKTGEIVDKSLIAKKTKGAAWYVSHCSTNSRREVFVDRLNKYFEVDKYGSCSDLKCPRKGNCENMLDNDYFFYVAFENSICKDYVTEKLWNQGFQKTIVPLVMKRSLVEPFVPPNSFIAIDDFKSVKEMGEYLHYLMKNQTAYLEYFEWKRDYQVVFLDGQNHDVLEKPWGVCQICRILWEQPKKEYIIEDWDKYWRQSCEADGDLINSIPDVL
ncbi:unnamed protein product [Caenorhabditis angaria]|uniref:Fucosyltransferase n=1 Tax=Caenorhabditis angaria TaxID=860376 RepID=A0A9P1MYW4_9PELO|nr:unnamed protein product [Caenorhabditis angaria]